MRVHLISPGFHGYWRAIADALASRGHHVSVHVYDRNSTSTDRVRHHLRHELPRRLGVGDHRAFAREQTLSTLRSLREARPEVIVVMKGDVLEDAFWERIDAAGLPRVTWLYDETRRTRFTSERLAAIGPVATYSALDHARLADAGVNSQYLPLAFDHLLRLSADHTARPEVSFVGARYPKREQVLLAMHAKGVPVRAYGRDWSSHPFDRLRTWRLTTPDVPAGRDLDRASAYAVMRDSSATLNLHGDQDGFTMRTFEAAGVGGVQLIDRDDVNDLYEPGAEVLTWTTNDDLFDLCNRVRIDTRWAARVRGAARARTLAEHTFEHRALALEAAWDTA